MMLEKLFELHTCRILQVSSLVVDLNLPQPLRMSGIYSDQSKNSGVVLHFLYTVQFDNFHFQLPLSSYFSTALSNILLSPGHVISLLIHVLSSLSSTTILFCATIQGHIELRHPPKFANC